MDEHAREIVDRLRWLLLRWLRRDRPPTVGPTLEEVRDAWQEAEEYLLSIGAIQRAQPPEEL
jgi:hypothetical protein